MNLKIAYSQQNWSMPDHFSPHFHSLWARIVDENNQDVLIYYIIII